MKTNPTEEVIDPRLAGVHLRHGAGETKADGMCVMQAVAWLGGEEKDGHLSDGPACACPVIRRFLINLNDQLDDENRQKLLPLVPLIVGSVASCSVQVRRAYLFADFAIRVILPWLCDKVGRRAEGERLRALQPVSDRVTAELARQEARSLRDVFRAAAYAYVAAADADAAYAYADADAAYAAAADAAYAYAAAADAAYAYAAAAYAAAKKKAFMAEILPLCLQAVRDALAIRE